MKQSFALSAIALLLPLALAGAARADGPADLTARGGEGVEVLRIAPGGGAGGAESFAAPGGGEVADDYGECFPASSVACQEFADLCAADGGGLGSVDGGGVSCHRTDAD